jgi:hypothetical protein
LIAAGIVKAAKSNNKEEYDKGQKNWSANADDISTFLSGANPNWPKKVLQDMLHKHLEYTTAEGAARLKKNWTADIEAYDKGHFHMLMFSDAVTEGIVKQFPKKFGKK